MKTYCIATVSKMISLQIPLIIVMQKNSLLFVYGSICSSAFISCDFKRETILDYSYFYCIALMKFTIEEKQLK